MPRSDSDDDTSKLIYNGSKAQWSNFNQEATVFTMSSEVMTAFKDGEAVKIEDQDDLGDFDKYFKHGYAKATTESVAAGNRYKTIGNYQALVRDARIKFYQWLFKHTKDEARDVVVSKGMDNIHEIMGSIQTLHGALKDAIVPEVEDALLKVKYWVPKTGNYETFNKKDALDKIPEVANMRKYFNGIDSMRKILIKNYADQNSLEQYDAIQLSRITKNIMLAIPEKYTGYVSILKFHYGHVKHESTHRKKVTNACVVAAYTEMQSQNSSADSIKKAVDEAHELAESSNKFDIMKADMIPRYETLKAALIKVQQDAELASNRAAKGSRIPAYNTGLRQTQQKTQKTKKVTGGCWDCSQPNCKTGHQGCRSPGELNFAPDRIREKHGLPPRQNNQKTKTHRNTNSYGAGGDSGKINKVCTFFKRGGCTKGENCKWLHPQGEQGKQRKVSLGNGNFERQVGRSFVKHVMQANLGPPSSGRSGKGRALEAESSDEERVYGEEGEEPLSSRASSSRRKKAKNSDKDAAREFLAKFNNTFNTFMVKCSPELQNLLLTGSTVRKTVLTRRTWRCVCRAWLILLNNKCLKLHQCPMAFWKLHSVCRPWFVQLNYKCLKLHLCPQKGWLRSR
jgi:hypothetical protein